MAIEIDKNKITKNGTEVITTPSITTTSTTSASHKTVNMEGQYYNPTETNQSSEAVEAENQQSLLIRENRANANKQAIDEMSETKKTAAKAAQEEEISTTKAKEAVKEGDYNTFNEISTNNKTKNETHKATEKPTGKVEVLADKNKTIYEKTSVLLDDYIKNHPEEYPQYASMTDKEKKQFRDSLMGQIFTKLTAKNAGARSKEEQKLATRELAILLTALDSKGVSLKDIQNNKSQMKSLIESGEKTLYNYMLSQIDTTDPNKALNDIAELYLTFTDEKFLTKEGSKKVQYMKNKQNAIIEMLGINPSKISNESKKISADIMVGLLKDLSESGMTLKDFEKASAKTQSHLLVLSLEKMKKADPQRYEKLPEDVKRGYDILIARDQLIERTKKDNPTERDLYNELKKIKDSGNLTEAQKELFEFYKGQDFISRKTGKDHLNSVSKTVPSTTIKTFITGKTYENQFYDELKDLKPGSKEANEIIKTNIENILNDPTLAGEQAVALHSALKKLGYTPQQIKEVFKQIPQDVKERFNSYGMGSLKSDTAAEFTNFVAQSGTEDMIETSNVIVQCLPEIRQPEFIENFGAKLTTTVFDKSLSLGINNAYDVKTASKTFSFIAQNRATDEGKSSIVQQSILTTQDSNRISAYTNSYKQIKDAVVTEAMAATIEHISNPENKSIVSSAVDYAVKNNGYSQTEIQNINTARQTGQSVYQNSSDDSSVSNKNEVQNTKTEIPQQGNTSTVYVNPSSVNAELRNRASAGADINYFEQVTKALESKKDTVIQRLTEIVEDYKKSVNSNLSDKTVTTDKVINEVVEKQTGDLAEKYLNKQQNINGVSSEIIEKLKTAYSSGGMASLYQKLGILGSSVQEKFLEYFAKNAGSDALRIFAGSYSGDKDIILSLYQNSNDPSLLLYLDGSSMIDLLSKGKIKMEDFLKYASASTIAMYMNELSKLGNKSELNKILGYMNKSAVDVALEKINAEKYASIPGGDAWMDNLKHNMLSASHVPTMGDALALGSDKLPMRGNYDKMKRRGPFYFSA